MVENHQVPKVSAGVCGHRRLEAEAVGSLTRMNQSAGGRGGAHPSLKFPPVREVLMAVGLICRSLLQEAG